MIWGWRRVAGAAVFLCFAVMGLAGGQAAAQSLEDALALAYWNNPTLKAERSALAALDNGVAEALSGWRPNLAATGGRSRSRTNIHYEGDILPPDRATLSPAQIGVTLSQRIADFGRTSGAVRGAEARVLAGRSTLAATEQAVLLGTASAYLDVVRSQLLLELNRANVTVLARQLAAAEAGYQRQMNTLTDMAQSQARLANAQADLRQAEEQLDNARGLYRQFVGEAPGSLEFPDWRPPLPSRSDEVIAGARAAQPQVLAASYRVEAAGAEVDSAEAELLPTVSFQAQDVYQSNSLESVANQREQSFGLSVAVPLYQSGAEHARSRARKQTLGQQRLLLDSARRAAEQEAIEAWNALQAARVRMISYEASVRANQLAYEGVVAENRRTGTRTMLDVLNAEQELFEARAKLVGARRDEAVASFRTVAAMGRLTADALNLAVVRYDPKVNYQDTRNRWFGLGDRETSAGEATHR